MSSQRTFLGLVIGSALAFAAAADTGSLRWRGEGNSIGLRAGNADFRVPCGSVAVPCDGGSTSALLYSSVKSPRSISMEVSHLDTASTVRMARPQGMSVSVIGKTGVAPDLGVYGRVGTFFGKSGVSLAPSTYGEGAGLSYGMGVSLELSRKASASFGVDSYDFRTATGEWRDVRAASLGLQLRY
jgi:OmpA-OmpF porin, OOP family